MTVSASEVVAAGELLRAVTNRPVLGTWSAPGRVNLIGEHTDYNEGFALPFAIDRRTAVAVAERPDRRIVVASTSARGVVSMEVCRLPELLVPRSRLRDELPLWSRYPLGVAAALTAVDTLALHDLRGLDLAFASRVPLGSGLSSSAALASATVVALRDVWGLTATRWELVEAGRIAENVAVGAPTGVMDHVASLLGRADHALLLDCRSLEVTSVELTLPAQGVQVVVIDTRVTHSHGSGAYEQRRQTCERAARVLGVPALRDLELSDLGRCRELLDPTTLRRVRHVVTEDARTLAAVRALAERDLVEVGRLLDQSHRSLREDFEVSSPELDLAVEAARRCGALGARMTGGGFGGCAIALVPDAGVGRLGAAIEGAYAARGWDAPHVFTVAADRGASREG